MTLAELRRMEVELRGALQNAVDDFKKHPTYAQMNFIDGLMTSYKVNRAMLDTELAKALR